MTSYDYTTDELEEYDLSDLMRIADDYGLKLRRNLSKRKIIDEILDYQDNIKTNINKDFLKAVKDGDVQRVKYLLEQGADIDFGDDAAIKQAASAGDLDMVKYLVDNNANQSAGLYPAAVADDLEIVNYLFSRGAYSAEALRKASLNNRPKVFELLLENDPEANEDEVLQMRDAIKAGHWSDVRKSIPGGH